MTEDITLVVPVYNDPRGIKTTLESFVNQESKELCVIDNGSDDETPAIIREYETEYSHVSFHTETTIQGSYAARNTGIRNTDSEILAFVDADMTVPDDWLKSALQTFQTNDADYMGCNVELTLPNNPTLAARYDHHTSFPVQQYLEHQQFAPTCCLFVRREVFDDVGLFDHRLVSGGDKEFGNRVHEAGYDMHFAENVTMYHPVRSSIEALAKKDFRVGRGHCQLQRYHPDRYGKPGIPPHPSGVKSPDRDLSTRDRLAFGALSKAMTGVRGLGYYREYLNHLRDSDETRESVPVLEE